MARIRTIKPDFFRHEGLQDLEAANPGCNVMLVFAALWGHADKAGRFEWRPRTLKLDILPFLDFDLAHSMSLLVEAGFMRRYTHDGKQYGEVINFEKHQRINNLSTTLQFFEGMNQDGFNLCCILSKLIRAKEWHLCAVSISNLGYKGIVC